jgi:hypothetical protein
MGKPRCDIFDGARHFSIIAAVTVGAAIIAYPVAGFAGCIGVAIGLYFLLSFFNSLERRDNNDDARKRNQRKR